MNTIVLVGNIGQHPVLRSTTSGTPVANVTLATNRVYRDRDGNRQQSTEWHRLTVWGEGAKNFAEIVSRGDLLSVRGRLEYREREIAGQKVQDAAIRVDEWTKLSPRKADDQASTAGDDGDGVSGEDGGATLEGEPDSGNSDPGEPAGDPPVDEALAEPASEEDRAAAPARKRRK